MRVHEGAHPCIGALDVVPIVYLRRGGPRACAGRGAGGRQPPCAASSNCPCSCTGSLRRLRRAARARVLPRGRRRCARRAHGRGRAGARLRPAAAAPDRGRDARRRPAAAGRVQRRARHRGRRRREGDRGRSARAQRRPAGRARDRREAGHARRRAGLDQRAGPVQGAAARRSSRRCAARPSRWGAPSSAAELVGLAPGGGARRLSRRTSSCAASTSAATSSRTACRPCEPYNSAHGQSRSADARSTAGRRPARVPPQPPRAAAHRAAGPRRRAEQRRAGAVRTSRRPGTGAIGRGALAAAALFALLVLLLDAPIGRRDRALAAGGRDLHARVPPDRRLRLPPPDAANARRQQSRPVNRLPADGRRMFTVGPVQENCFIARRDGSDRA